MLKISGQEEEIDMSKISKIAVTFMSLCLVLAVGACGPPKNGKGTKETKTQKDAEKIVYKMAIGGGEPDKIGLREAGKLDVFVPENFDPVIVNDKEIVLTRIVFKPEPDEKRKEIFGKWKLEALEGRDGAKAVNILNLFFHDLLGIEKSVKVSDHWMSYDKSGKVSVWVKGKKENDSQERELELSTAAKIEREDDLAKVIPAGDEKDYVVGYVVEDTEKKEEFKFSVPKKAE